MVILQSPLGEFIALMPKIQKSLLTLKNFRINFKRSFDIVSGHNQRANRLTDKPRYKVIRRM